MSTSTPVDLHNITLPDSASLAAYLTLEIKAAAGEPVTPAPHQDSDDLDGCDVPVEHATSDEDLPASEGGVA